MKKKDWYELKIEEPLRGLVRHLRNNGVNTTISCAHEMYICCFWSPSEPIGNLKTLVFEYLAEKRGRDAVNFDIEMRMAVIFGEPEYPPTRINLYMPEEQKSFLLKEKRRITRKGNKKMTPREIRALPPKTKRELVRVNSLLSELTRIER